MIKQSTHHKKFAENYNLERILAIPEEEQVEADNKTGRAMRKMKRVNRNDSDESGNEEGDEQISGTYDMQLVTVKGPPEIDTSHT